MNNKIPKLTGDYSIEVDKSALLVVDMQNFSINTEYGWGQFLKENNLSIYSYFYDRLKEIVIPNTNKLIAKFKSKNLNVIYITVGSYSQKDYNFLRSNLSNEAKEQIPPIAINGTIEHEISSKISLDKNDDIIINKISKSPFNSTGLDLLLKKMDLKYLFVTGVHTSSCVDLTARHAVDLGYHAIIIDDASATFTQELHESCLLSYEVFFDNVMLTNEVLKIL